MAVTSGGTAAPARSGSAPAARAGHSGTVTVDAVGGDAHRIQIRDRTLLVDQPVDAGGEDRGPTPTELFVASLAACVAFYAGRYLSRHGLTPDGLRVTADWGMAVDRPARVAAVRLRLTVPEALPEDRRRGLLAVASHCTVHNSLVTPPRVHIELG